MTLIVGIKCSDGVVLAADGAATLDATGMPTVLQSTKKLYILKDSIIVGVSGPVGLAQRIRGEIESLWEGDKLKGIKRSFVAMQIIRKALWEYIKPELEAAAIARQVIGDVACRSALSSTLAALPISKSPCLFQFNEQGAPEEATQDLPFVAIGSGQHIADPFLAFLRRIFWKEKPPTVVDAVFAALWTLEHAIQTSPGGIADPKQVIVLKRENGNWRAKELMEEELEDHQEAISAAEDTLKKFRSAFRENENEIIPEPPPVPS